MIQFGHGQSNPTFLLEVEYNSNISRYVLRKKPPGKLLQSAHAIEREYQVVIILISSSMIFFLSFLIHNEIYVTLGDCCIRCQNRCSSAQGLLYVQWFKHYWYPFLCDGVHAGAYIHRPWFEGTSNNKCCSVILDNYVLHCRWLIVLACCIGFESWWTIKNI